jgi:hypothetical protein
MSTQIINQLHEETKTLIQQIQTSTQDYFEIFNGLENLYSTRDKVYKEKIENCTWQMYAPARQLIEEALEEIYRKAIDSSKTDSALIEPLRTFFLRPFNKWRARYDLIAALGDAKSAQLVFERVNEQLKKDVGDDIDRAAIMSLVDLAAIPAHREQVLKIVRTGFDACIKSAGRKLVNDTIFNVLGQLCVALNDKQAAGELYKALVFAAHEDQHYEMNTAASRLSVYLTALDYKGPVDAIKNYVDHFTESYEDDEFVVRARYAYWWFEKKSDEALDFLSDPEKKKSLGMAAALLADLNEKKALPILQKRFKELTNKITIEVFKEAIVRLEAQQNVPENKDRMIWMFGFITESEIALGDETDNIFIKRANQSSEVDLGIVHEVDDSTKEDL